MKIKLNNMIAGGLLCTLPGMLAPCGAAENQRPNVLFLIIDDLNDWLSVLDRDNPIRMPNLERLARQGALFTHAYCPSPVCNPSRASVMTGLRPHKTGVYGNKTDWRGALPEALTIQQYFMRSGYYSAGAGKVFHHHWDGAFHDDASFDDFQPMPKTYPDSPLPEKKLNGLEWYGSRNTDWGAWPAREQDAVDYKTASYGVGFLEKKHERPFILSIGIFRPHMPLFAPQAWFDQYKQHDVVMPRIKPDDWNDLPSGAAKLLKPNRWFWKGMEKALGQNPRAWQDMVMAYQACASFADAQIGRVLDALDRSRYKSNTIIVLWSDNGFHLGEKQHIEKFALWEKSTHVPLIFAAPGWIKAGTVIDRPVDLTAIYPTLIELCGLKPKNDLDGQSLAPLFANPDAEFPPALTTYLRGNHAIRSGPWRYIHYADGTEELYNHTTDADEWNNLAGDPKYESTINRLRAFVPKNNAEAAANMKKPASVVNTEYQPK